MYLCPPNIPCKLNPQWIVTWEPGCSCVAVYVCVSQSPYFWTYTLVKMNTCISTWIYVHLTAHVYSTPMYSLMETWVALCGSVCVCPSHPPSGHAHWLECVHASVHELMSTWLPMSAPPPMHSLMETCVPLYGSVFVSQSPHFRSHTLFRMCIWIVHVFLSIWLPILAWPPLHCYMETWISLCDSVCVFQWSYCWSHTPWLRFLHASVHVYMSTWLTMSASPFLNSYMETWVPLCGSVCVAVILLVVPHLD